MNNNLDPDTLKIPAFLRNKTLVSQSRQKLILTALDRKDAGLSPHSKKALAPVKADSAASRVTSGTSGTQKTSKSRFTRDESPGLRFARNSRLGGNLFPQQPAARPSSPQPAAQESYGQPLFGDTLFGDSPDNFSLPENRNFQCIGEVTHYLDKIGVAIIMLSGTLKENETVLIQGEESIFLQTAAEIQIDRKPVPKAKKGAHIGLKVDRPAAINGKVYLFR
jgi:hypothetical protein